MITRAIFAGAAVLILSAVSAGAQGKTPKPVIISKTVQKSMVAHKTKSKAPLGAKIGLAKRKSLVVAPAQNAAPTSVREIPKKN